MLPFHHMARSFVSFLFKYVVWGIRQDCLDPTVGGIETSLLIDIILKGFFIPIMGKFNEIPVPRQLYYFVGGGVGGGGGFRSPSGLFSSI